MLEGKNLYKSYFLKEEKKSFFKKNKTEINVVKDVSIKVLPGKIVGLLGVNGAGKTTTIKMLSAMIKPTSGTVQIDNIDAVKNDIEAKKMINLIVGGERNLYWRLTGKENLEYFGALYNLNKKNLNERISTVLDIVDLRDQQDIKVEKYSKGMKQRLQIARGLINDPQYIFMDEPTLGLDILIAKELRIYIKKMAIEENKGILLTTHYMREAEELCDYIYVIDCGKIIFEGNSQELKNRYILTSKKITFKVSFITDTFKNEVRKIFLFSEIEIFDDNTFTIMSEKEILKPIIDLIENSDMQLLSVVSDELTMENALIHLMEEKHEK